MKKISGTIGILIFDLANTAKVAKGNRCRNKLTANFRENILF